MTPHSKLALLHPIANSYILSIHGSIYIVEAEIMYCPNCAAQNNEETKFCRVCGANLSLVPQALTGKLSRRASKEEKHEKNQLANGIRESFMGLAFLIVAIVLWVSKQWWGIWMLIPAFALLGKGVAQIVTDRLSQPPQQNQVQAPPATYLSEPPRRNTGELYPPISVTENTTRHLDSTIDHAKERQ